MEGRRRQGEDDAWNTAALALDPAGQDACPMI